MQFFAGPLKELAEYEEIQKKRTEKQGMIQISGCVTSQKTHLMYALGDGFKRKIIAVSSELKAKQIYEEYRFLDSDVWIYPAKDLLFYQADLRGKFLIKQRMEVYQALLEQEQVTVITSFDGFMDSLLPLEEMEKRVISLEAGQELDFEKLKKDMVLLGYEREERIEGPGQFAVRGGILDIYPLTEEVPVRIEMWGDEIDSIRTFDVESQRSIENLESIRIYPATDFPEEQAKRVSFLDYFDKKTSMLFLDEPVRLIEKGESVLLEIDIQGAMQVKEHYPQGVFVYIVPPSFDVLSKRIYGRGTDSEEVIKKRLAQITDELAMAHKYDYIIVNDVLEEAVHKTCAILEAESCKLSRNEGQVEVIFKQYINKEVDSL